MASSTCWWSGAGINGAVSAASLAGRGASVALIDRGDFGSFTSQESSNLVWGGFKYLEHYELPLVFEAVPLPQPADEGLPRQHQGDRLPRRARPHRAVPPVVRRTRGHRVLGDRPVRHQAAEAVRRRADRGGRAGHRHPQRPRRHRSTRTRTSSTTTPGSCSRSSVRRSRPAPRRPTTSSWSAPSGVGDRWVAELRDIDTRRGAARTSARVDRQRRRPVRRRAQQPRGA